VIPTTATPPKEFVELSQEGVVEPEPDPEALAAEKAARERAIAEAKEKEMDSAFTDEGTDYDDAVAREQMRLLQERARQQQKASQPTPPHLSAQQTAKEEIDGVPVFRTPAQEVTSVHQEPESRTPVSNRNPRFKPPKKP
jgi:hypothetical protein